MQQLFRNKQLNEEYVQNGFVKIPFVEVGILEDLKKMLDSYCSQVTHHHGQVFYSVFANSLDKNLVLKREINSILQDVFQSTFMNYRTFAEMFLVKQPDSQPLELHQDWSYTHESSTPAATLWLPLQKTTKENGTLFLVPGSHRLFQNYRSGSLPSVRIPVDDLLEKQLVTVEVEEGEAIIFHPAIFHGSHPNTGKPKQNRIVAACIILPETSQPLYFHQPPGENQLQSIELTDSVFFEHLQSLSCGNLFEGAIKNPVSAYHHHLPTAFQLLERVEQPVKYAI